MVRFRPPDLELQRLSDCADADSLIGIDVHPTIVGWLHASHPELFEARDLIDRLRLYSVAYALRHLIVAPPDGPEDSLEGDHSLVRLRRLLDGRWPASGALPSGLIPPG